MVEVADIAEAVSTTSPDDSTSATFTWVDADGTVEQLVAPASKPRIYDDAGALPGTIHLPAPRWLPPDPLYVPEPEDEPEVVPEPPAAEVIQPDPPPEAEPQAMAEPTPAPLLISEPETIEIGSMLEAEAVGPAEFLQLDSIEPPREWMSATAQTGPSVAPSVTERRQRLLIAVLIAALVWAYLRRARVLP